MSHEMLVTLGTAVVGGIFLGAFLLFKALLSWIGDQ